MTSASTDWRATMASNEASSGPTVEPVIWPISSDGKKPLGIVWNRIDGQHEGAERDGQHEPRQPDGALRAPRHSRRSALLKLHSKSRSRKLCFS